MMRKLLVSAVALVALSGAAYADDFVGTPGNPGSGETGYFHFPLLEFPGFEFCIPANGTNQQLQWSVMVTTGWGAGKQVRVHAGSAAPGCRGVNTDYIVTGIGEP